MRRSKKETIVLDPQNRMPHNGIAESHTLEGASFVAEAALEWASGSTQVKLSPRKPVR